MHGTASGIGTACAMIVLDVAIGCVATNKNTQVKIRGVEVAQPRECETHSTPQTTQSIEQSEKNNKTKYIITIVKTKIKTRKTIIILSN